jgi:ribosomal-protein-alanine N-acetyltransferase
MEGAAADTKQFAVIDLWYRSGGGLGCSSVDGQRCLVQLSAQPLGGHTEGNGLATMIDLYRPTGRFEAEFLAGARRSRSLHRHYAYPARTPEGFREYVHRCRRPSHEGHLLVDRESGSLVGVVNVMEIVRGSFQGAYLGYFLFSPYTGRGFMSEGLSLVLCRAFTELRLHRLEANIQPDNERSLRLVRKLGFRREGFSPRYLKQGGRWRDHERWALLREHWCSPRVAA